jgi:glycosyltransferase involved in cell wall biosynthesis
MSPNAGDALVSVIIPCYRQAQFLRTAIDSVLMQTYPHIEIIVVNDGSDDDTEAVAKSYGVKVQYLHRQNGGLSAARNTGIAQARGTYFKFLDADDHIHPEQIAWHVESLAGRTDRVSLTGVRLYRDGMPEQYEDHAPTHRHLLPFLLQDNSEWIPPVGYLVPAALTRAVNGFNQSYPCFEDWDFFSRVGLHDPQLLCDQRIGGFYRLRPGSMSANRRRMAIIMGKILVELHDVLWERERLHSCNGQYLRQETKVPFSPDWFGTDLLKAEQGAYQKLVMQGGHDPKLLDELLSRIMELQRREGFGQYGWRFRLMAHLLGYARAERVRSRMVKLLKKQSPQSLDTGAWREQ